MRSSRIYIFLVLVIVACSLFASGCQTMDGALNAAASVAASSGYLPSGSERAIVKTGKAFFKAAEGVTEEQEYYLGRAVSVNLLDKYPYYENPKVQEYVNKVGTAVVAASETPETFGGYHFAVLDSEEINAMAAPGGFVFITLGTFKLAGNEDELASILAHEVAHVRLKHGVGTIKSSRMSNLAAVAASQAGSVALNNYTSVDIGSLTDIMQGAVTDITKDLVTKGYSRGKEYEADAMAIEVVSKAGYNPVGLSNFLAAMNSETCGESGGGWFKTHPKAKDRLGKVNKVLGSEVSNKEFYGPRTERFLFVEEQVN